MRPTDRPACRIHNNTICTEYYVQPFFFFCFFYSLIVLVSARIFTNVYSCSLVSCLCQLIHVACMCAVKMCVSYAKSKFSLNSFILRFFGFFPIQLYLFKNWAHTRTQCIDCINSNHQVRFGLIRIDNLQCDTISLIDWLTDDVTNEKFTWTFLSKQAHKSFTIQKLLLVLLLYCLYLIFHCAQFATIGLCNGILMFSLWYFFYCCRCCYCCRFAFLMCCKAVVFSDVSQSFSFITLYELKTHSTKIDDLLWYRRGYICVSVCVCVWVYLYFIFLLLFFFFVCSKSI